MNELKVTTKQYINKAALIAEIERLKADALQKKSQCKRSGLERIMHQIGAYNKILSFLDTLEVKDANEALRTEYEKGRHDVIGKTLEWLWDLNQQHEIMSYTDSHVLDSEELQKYYKNNIEE